MITRVIVGTAGHVDHGKTALVKALTGTDCDRWAEEKSRGITIDLGFAHLNEQDVQLGFVDVPGHERFLHNALAGLGGIRIALLVVAANERVRPQTREHLAVCSLLQVPTLVVAITKRDLVSNEALQLAELEVEELLANSRFADAPILPVSSKTGEGLSELTQTLCDRAKQLDTDDVALQPARLPIDRAFHLKGLGVIVTGTLIAGAIQPGDSLELLPKGLKCRVRNVHVHNQPREQAFAGERVSLQLTGVDLSDVGRGMQLASCDLFRPMVSALATVTTMPDMPPVTRSTVWRIYLHSADVVCRVRPLTKPGLKPGEHAAVVEILPDDPLVGIRGDRFILRHSAAQMTAAGGVILTPFWEASRHRPSAAGSVPIEASRQDVILGWLDVSGASGLDARDLAARLGTGSARLEHVLRTLAESGRVQPLASLGHKQGRWIARRHYDAVVDRVRETLECHDRTDDCGRGMMKGTALKQLFAGVPVPIAELYLGRLIADNVLAFDKDRVTVPGKRVLPPEESTIVALVLDRFEHAGLKPPSLEDLHESLQVPTPAVDTAMRHLESRGRLVRMPQGLLCEANAVSKLCDDLHAASWERFTVPQFKDRFGLSRKWAIPLLEYLDSIGVTERMGDERMLRRA